MLTVSLEWLLMLMSAAATVVSLVHLIESMRAVRIASTARFPVRLLVARMGRRAAILRVSFALTLLACAFLLVGVPDQNMDYPRLINGFTLFLAAAAVAILVFGVVDIRDRRRVTELLQKS